MADRSGVPIALTLLLASCAVQPRAAPTVEAIVALQGMAASGREPPRPRLPPGSDTNSAVPYYERAVRLARSSIKLDTADIYLYWASRLDPAWADPIFLRGVLILRAFRKDALDGRNAPARHRPEDLQLRRRRHTPGSPETTTIGATAGR